MATVTRISSLALVAPIRSSPAKYSADYGQKFSFHNDTMVTPISPLQSIASGVTRVTAKSKMWEGGTVISGSRPVVLLNAFVLLPAYAAAFGMPMDALVGMGSAVNKAITSLPTFVLFAVVPFNIIKGVVVSLVTMLLYKHISRLLKGEAMN